MTVMRVLAQQEDQAEDRGQAGAGDSDGDQRVLHDGEF